MMGHVWVEIHQNLQHKKTSAIILSWSEAWGPQCRWAGGSACEKLWRLQQGTSKWPQKKITGNLVSALQKAAQNSKTTAPSTHQSVEVCNSSTGNLSRCFYSCCTMTISPHFFQINVCNYSIYSVIILIKRLNTTLGEMESKERMGILSLAWK